MPQNMLVPGEPLSTQTARIREQMSGVILKCWQDPAFKAALLAWQLVSAGYQEPIAVLNIHDKKEMYHWIKEVFERRKHWCVGRLGVESLGELGIEL